MYVDVLGPSSRGNSSVEVCSERRDSQGVGRKASYACSAPVGNLFDICLRDTGRALIEDDFALLARLQGVVNMAVLSHEDTVCLSFIRRVSMPIAKAVGWQLTARLPWWEGLPHL